MKMQGVPTLALSLSVVEVEWKEKSPCLVGEINTNEK